MTDTTEGLDVLAKWLADYAERPIPELLYQMAERRQSSVRDAITLGHGAALIAIAGVVKGLMHASRTGSAPPSSDAAQVIEALGIFRLLRSPLKAAGEAPENPSETNEINSITEDRELPK